MSYIRINAKVSMMTDGELHRRREELYQAQPSNNEDDRLALYMELGLIEERIIAVSAPIRLPRPLLEGTRPTVSPRVSFQWVRPPSF